MSAPEVPSSAGSRSFPQSVIEHLDSYVYVLRDPCCDGAPVFYVGKGTGNRVFDHAREAIDRPVATDKLHRIRAIHAAGKEVVYQIIRHGLTQEQALEVVSALIDFVGIDDLANAVDGHHADRRGMRRTAGLRP